VSPQVINDYRRAEGAWTKESVAGLNQLPHLQNTVPHGVNKFRLPQEQVVYHVRGRLALFKDEKANDYTKGAQTRMV